MSYMITERSVVLERNIVFVEAYACLRNRLSDADSMIGSAKAKRTH